MQTLPAHLRHRCHTSQRGVALYVVIVLVLLCMLLALWAARSALFNELLVGNDADYRRTFEAAQAMLQDAEFDIRGINPDGSSCPPTTFTPNSLSGTNLCRPLGSVVYFNFEAKDLANMLSTVQSYSAGLGTNPITNCYLAICEKRADPQDFWNDASTLAAMTSANVGAFYGQFTGATADPNSLLAPPPNQKAWYWIEILPYVDTSVTLLTGSGTSANTNLMKFAPSTKQPWIYRITALARGQKAGTVVILQSTVSIQTVE